jgi:hypothetical protein
MTFEHKIVVGLEEIKGIIFECNQCKSRTVLTPESANFPPQKCPNGHGWNWNVSTGYGSTESPFQAFLTSLKKLRDPLSESVGFKIFLEFEEPKP